MASTEASSVAVQCGCAASFAPGQTGGQRKSRTQPRYLPRAKGIGQPPAPIREQLKTKITRLDRQEDGYLDLIGDPDWPKEKITPRLRHIRDDRERLQRQLAATDNPQINAGREAIEILLDLLNDPREIYRLASKRARKVLNQAFFVKMYVDMNPGGPYIATDECTETVNGLHTLETPASSSRGLTNDHLVDPTVGYSNWLDNLKSTQDALGRLASDPLITDEPDLGSRTMPIDV